MRTILQSVNSRRLLGILLAASSVLMGGCRTFPEASFDLAKESRPPKWMPVPPGLTRAKVSITMDSYIEPWGFDVRFIMKDNHGKILKTIDGREKCGDPITLKHPPPGYPANYPSYEAIAVDGVTEMMEHRKMEPFFYVTDDAAVWKQYLATGCN